jgi:hypothetical protein
MMSSKKDHGSELAERIIAAFIVLLVVSCLIGAVYGMFEFCKEMDRLGEIHQRVNQKTITATRIWNESSSDDKLISVTKMIDGYVVAWERQGETYVSPVFKESMISFNYDDSISKSTVTFRMNFNNVDDTLDITQPIDMLNYCCTGVTITFNDISLLQQINNK